MKKMIIVGAGLAALSCIRHLDGDAEVVLFTKDRMEENNSHLAQGGICHSGREGDEGAGHLEDTYTAGDALGSKEIIGEVIRAGHPLIEEMIAGGMAFDEDEAGCLDFAMEGGHHSPRILHAGGDRSGEHLCRFLAEGIDSSRVEIHTGETVIKVLTGDEGAAGVVTVDSEDVQHHHFCDAVILATGGFSGLYTVNSGASPRMGSGHILAWEAGVALRQMEMVQFHPTLLGTAGRTYGLVSEAVRGAGGVLRAEYGGRIMEDVHPLEDLAPRHVTSYEIHKRALRGEQTYLDINGVKDFPGNFPTIHENVKRHFEVDLQQGRIPVTAGAHFTMGGAVADIDGSTSVPDLYVIGETAHTHFHGANRLASNALLEALVMGAHAAGKINRTMHRPKNRTFTCKVKVPVYDVSMFDEIKERAMSAAGIIRSGRPLMGLLGLIDEAHQTAGTGTATTQNFQAHAEMKTIEAVVKSALLREETRGGHRRADFPGARTGPLMDTIVSMKEGKMDAQYIERQGKAQTILH
ncbi:FAD-binding protein [Lacicoccus alkaliphilus]|uniref:L-aspartate oxidase n=1 Tax=Lacicoccus alkaliphilus DSM 16010 TaxID=1123231 RepID=A0A1M7JRR0_9BACL|nr:FAD-binding protein [Salinicoccus alkaliphilus]SHM55591.1 L-aspartate oxidase [Salinicoccus alkaliphilus DSM 16010]